MAEPFTVVDYGGSVFAWADEWPGLVTSAPTLAELDSTIPLALAEYGDWLRRHGEDGPGRTWRISERIGSADGPTQGDPCYLSDLRPLGEREFERFLRHSTHSQLDLQTVADVPDALLDWTPEAAEPEQADPWAPGVRTIREVLTHALQLEVFYREGLRDGAAAGIFAPVGSAAEEHAATRAAFERAASERIDREWHPLRVLRPGGTPEPAGEWTVRKALRRTISHNRAHCAEILQRKTWILLGTPKGAS